MPAAARARAWLGNLALLACSLLVALGGLELAARWQLARPVRGKGQGGEARLRFHPLLGWEKAPGSVESWERDDFRAVERINSRGLRDVERAYPAGAAFRVLALGDSFVEGYTVELERTVTRQLEGRLRQGGCPAEVVNGATAGYGTDQEWLFFREEGRRYEPRLVLLFFFSNDLDSNVRVQYFGAPKPLVAPGPGGLEPVNTPLHERPPQAEADPAGGPAPEPPQGSALWYWLQRRMLRGAPRAYAWLAGWGLWAPVRPQPAPPTYWGYFEPPDPRVRRQWQRFEEILAALQADVTSTGARLALVYIPAKFEVRSREAYLTSVSYGMEGGRWDATAVSRRLGQAADRLGLPLLDLTGSLRRAEGSWWGGSTYLERDAHWTARGHAVAAEAVASWLAGQPGLLDCRAPSR